MARTNELRREVSPTGLTLWRHPDMGSLSIMWAGPGARLWIGQCTVPGGAVSTIEHPSADGAYDDRASADRAVRAFVAIATAPE